MYLNLHVSLRWKKRTAGDDGIACFRMLSPCRFPGTKAAYEAVVDVADNEVIADAQVRSTDSRQLRTHFLL